MKWRNLVGLICAGSAAILLILSAFSNSWRTRRHERSEIHVGLRHVKTCVTSQPCSVTSLSNWAQTKAAPRALSSYVSLSTLCFYLSLITSGLLIILVVYGAANAGPRWPIHPASLTLVLTLGILISSTLTLVFSPFQGDHWEMGLGFVILGTGEIGAMAAALILGRSPKNIEENWFL